MQRNTTTHFFGSRTNGENKSAPDSMWRYGRGNVFAPSKDHPEYKNASTNVDAVMQDFKLESCHPGVILQSQYGKGISVVNEEFLNNTSLTRDQTGRIIINADGLFTTLKGIPLLNKSGDAHAIIFESDEAIGILVGAWKCLGKDIINYMLDNFKRCNISFDKITVYIGPGLGKDSYSIGKPTYEELKKVFGDALDQAVVLKSDKNNQSKYVFNVHALMKKYSELFGFKIDVSESQDTFDKKTWKTIKNEAINNKNPELPIKYYEHASFFSARLYVRVDRLSRRIATSNGQSLPNHLVSLPNDFDYENIKKAGEQGRYNETGRCLNGVMRK